MKFELPNSIPKERREIISTIISGVTTGGWRAEVSDTRPSRKFFMGTLSPRPTTEELISLANKVSPPTIGLEYLIKKDYSTSSTLTIKVSGAFYYRIFPDYEEQKEYSKRAVAEGAKSSPLKEKYRRTEVDIKPISIGISEAIAKCKKEGEVFVSLKEDCERLWAEAYSDPKFFSRKKKGRGRKYPRVPFGDLESKEKYKAYITAGLESPPPCPWNIGIRIEAYETGEGWRFNTFFSNMADALDDPTIENTVFEAWLKVALIGEEFKKFELDYLESNYRYDRLIEAAGHNCSFNVNSPSEIETVHFPIFLEKRKNPVECGADISFEKLAKDPFQALSEVGEFLKERLVIFKEKYEGTVKTAAEKESFASDVKMAERELSRYSNGISALKESRECLRAFKLMNKAFLYTSRSNEEMKFSSWYTFQIAYIVSLLPDIIHPHLPQKENYRDFVDLLYYPTGGGKTEAFLGLAIFQSFFDRIMGKEFGVSVLTKFPLRMLSLQQLQRIANIFAQAELVRLEEEDINSEQSEFSVGYFVGQTSTPNRLILYDQVKRSYYDLLDELENNKSALENYQILTKCPFCQSKHVELKVDKERRRLLHVCGPKGCGRELPIYISDWEIYRHLPTFIVGTLDKFVSVGFQINFRNILGGIRYRCPKHGFSSSQECLEAGPKSFPVCTTGLEGMEEVPEGDYSPSLIIQDEMHLVRDTMGTFNSHYETLIDKLIFELSGKKKHVKKIAATATISPSTYADHVKELYMREPILFPANLELFTEEAEEIARVIVGIMPHAKTQINAIEEVVGSIAISIQQSINKKGFPKDEARDFWTILTYHNKRNDAYQFGRSIGTRINENMMEPLHLKELKKETLTGEVTFKEIRDIMDSIESGTDYQKAIDTLIATSIISHGVDIASLNLMAFMGMPPNNAEYIQALSRIGRRKTGLAFIVFSPTRERDRSYFKFFKKFHELRDLLVESIPICRWSKKAIERTCPGVFMGSLLGHFDFIARSKGASEDLRFVGPLNDALGEPFFTTEELQDFVKCCYLADRSERPDEISKLIEDNVSKHVNSVLSKSTPAERHVFVGMALTPNSMTSLRDIDRSVWINLDSDTYAALKTGMISSSKTGGE